MRRMHDNFSPSHHLSVVFFVSLRLTHPTPLESQSASHLWDLHVILRLDRLYLRSLPN